MESMRRWDQQIPEMLSTTLRESIQRLQEARANNVVPLTTPIQNEFSDIFEVDIEPPTDPDSDEATIRAVVPLGRRLWIASMRHVLTGAANTLCGHRWSVVEPEGDAEWPLTDHPVLRLITTRPANTISAGGGASRDQRSLWRFRRGTFYTSKSDRKPPTGSRFRASTHNSSTDYSWSGHTDGCLQPSPRSGCPEYGRALLTPPNLRRKRQPGMRGIRRSCKPRRHQRINVSLARANMRSVTTTSSPAISARSIRRGATSI
jgi:hypothetical protein